MIMTIVSYWGNSCYVKGVRVLFMNQKYMMAFCSSTYLFFVVALKIAGFSISFSSWFNILFHIFGAGIVIRYLPFVSLKDEIVQTEKHEKCVNYRD